ncbi:MAG: hypothetical protein PHE52_03135 [Candidatus Pacebacteria bacterium]|nr:hypothetical protein [Candidatus Paceibacterota bacterium]
MEENKQNDKKINPDVLKWVIVGLAGFVILILIFSVGFFVGETKARFSYRWAENYHQNFGGPKEGFMAKPLPFMPGDFIESRGTFGQIIQINDSDLVIKGKDDAEKIILIKEDTVIESGREKVTKDTLKVDDYIVIIGSPNEQGQIEAKLIRVFRGNDMTFLPMSPRESFFR